jgi:selenocysteine lyase/cysteine desulfurase
MESIDKVREWFPVTRNKVFLNHAAQSPLPKPVADVVRKFAEDFSNFGDTSIEWNNGGKTLFAKLIGAKPEEIALIENTSSTSSSKILPLTFLT